MKNIKFTKKKKVPTHLIAALSVIATAVVVAGIFIAVKLVSEQKGKQELPDSYSFSTEGFENISDIKSLNEEMAVFTDYSSGKKGLMTLDGKITEKAEHNDFSVISDSWRSYRYIVQSPRSEYLLLVDTETKTVTSRQYHGLTSPERIPCWQENVRHLAWTDKLGYAGEVKPSEVGLPAGLYPVANSLKDDAKYGYISHLLRLEIALVYENASDFSNGFAAVKENGKWGYINEKGVTVIPFELDSCMSADAMGSDCAFGFRNGLVPVCKGEKFGIINSKNEAVVDFSFDRILQGINGTYIALKDGKWGIITIKKEFISAETTTSAAVASAAGDVLAKGSYTVKTAGSVLNMRAEAYAQSDVIAKIPNGTVINVTKSVPGWAYAKYNSFSGWVSADFLVSAPKTTSASVESTVTS